MSEIDRAEVDDASWGCCLHLKRTTAAHRGAVAQESDDGFGVDRAAQRDVESLKCGASVKGELLAGSQGDCAVDSICACGPTFASRPLPNNASRPRLATPSAVLTWWYAGRGVVREREAERWRVIDAVVGLGAEVEHGR